MAAPTLALLAGLVYAIAEALRQFAVPSPPGVPGDSGGSLLSLFALGVVNEVHIAALDEITEVVFPEKQTVDMGHA